MEYTADINTLLDALKERINGLRTAEEEPLFADVRIACIDGFGRLCELLPDLAVPAAVLVAGTTEYEDAGASRRINIGVILVSSFSCAPEEARASYGRLEAVCSLLTGDAPGAAVNIGGAHVLLNNFQPLEIDNGTNTEFVLDLTAQTSFKMEV